GVRVGHHKGRNSGLITVLEPEPIDDSLAVLDLGERHQEAGCLLEQRRGYIDDRDRGVHPSLPVDVAILLCKSLTIRARVLIATPLLVGNCQSISLQSPCGLPSWLYAFRLLR